MSVGGSFWRGVLFGLVVSTCTYLALALVLSVVSARAESEPTNETLAAAADAGVDALDLQGAVNTSGFDPRTYLCLVGELACLKPQTPREYAYATYPDVAVCIDRIVAVESPGWFTHGWNPVPVGRLKEHASGLGGFLPSTWSSTPEAARSIWDPFAQVDAIAYMLHARRGGEFAAVAWGRCR